MKREEEIRQMANVYTKTIFGELDDFADITDAYIDGAKWADETMIEKACKWLYCIDSYIECSNPTRDEIVSDLRKYLEE